MVEQGTVIEEVLDDGKKVYGLKKKLRKEKEVSAGNPTITM